MFRLSSCGLRSLSRAPVFACAFIAVASSAATTRAANYVFTTINDPLPTDGPGSGTSSTTVRGISGSNVVGFYVGPSGGSGGEDGLIYNVSTYTTLDCPLTHHETAATRVIDRPNSANS